MMPELSNMQWVAWDDTHTMPDQMKWSEDMTWSWAEIHYEKWEVGISMSFEHDAIHMGHAEIHMRLTSTME